MWACWRKRLQHLATEHITQGQYEKDAMSPSSDLLNHLYKSGIIDTEEYNNIQMNGFIKGRKKGSKEKRGYERGTQKPYEVTAPPITRPGTSQRSKRSTTYWSCEQCLAGPFTMSHTYCTSCGQPQYVLDYTAERTSTQYDSGLYSRDTGKGKQKSTETPRYYTASQQYEHLAVGTPSNASTLLESEVGYDATANPWIWSDEHQRYYYYDTGKPYTHTDYSAVESHPCSFLVFVRPPELICLQATM
jgi:hypothetical protein